MKQPITTLLFDFDGTLADTTRTILKAMSLTIVELGLPLPSETQMKSGIGLPLRACIQKAGHVPEELANRAAELYHYYFFQVAFGTQQIESLGEGLEEKADGAAVLYDGVKETLALLREQGYVLGIATSRRWETLELSCAISASSNGSAPSPPWTTSPDPSRSRTPCCMIWKNWDAGRKKRWSSATPLTTS